MITTTPKGGFPPPALLTRGANNYGQHCEYYMVTAQSSSLISPVVEAAAAQTHLTENSIMVFLHFVSLICFAK